MYSEARQDEFVMHMMNGKVGEYLEIGAWHPIITNNTLLLEENGWVGKSFDINPQFVNEWALSRKNPLVISNALLYDFEEKEHIDYLQLDIEPPSKTFAALVRLFELNTTYSIITFETDAYGDDSFVEPSRKLFLERGYKLAVPDVTCRSGPFEDWYIHPDYIDVNLLNTWK